MTLKRTPLPPRSAPLRPVSLLRLAAASRPRETAGAARRPARSAGEFSARVKAAVRARAGQGDPGQALCEAHGDFLGLHGGQIQHVVARGAGGRHGAAAQAISSIVNAALLCCPAHALAESRDEDMKAKGFWRPLNETPGVYPFLLHGQRWVYRTADGGYASAAAPAEIGGAA
jgi:hypothetical protein